MMRILKLKKFYWQVYKPRSLLEWLFVPIFQRVVVGYLHVTDGERLLAAGYKTGKGDIQHIVVNLADPESVIANGVSSPIGAAKVAEMINRNKCPEPPESPPPRSSKTMF